MKFIVSRKVEWNALPAKIKQQFPRLSSFRVIKEDVPPPFNKNMHVACAYVAKLAAVQPAGMLEFSVPQQSESQSLYVPVPVRQNEFNELKQATVLLDDLLQRDKVAKSHVLLLRQFIEDIEYRAALAAVQLVDNIQMLQTTMKNAELEFLTKETCQHPWHANPALITPCPECGAGADDSEPNTETGDRD